MNWICDSIGFLSSLGGALALLLVVIGWAKFALSRELREFKKEYTKFKEENLEFQKQTLEFQKETVQVLKTITSELNSINLRLTRLEGRFDERGYWESRNTGTGNKK